MDTSFDLRRLQHLVVLAEELNFTRAALRANLSQAAFSRSIQHLEQRFAVRIFDRGTRSVRVTAAGRQLVDRARHLIAQARDYSRQIEDISSAGGGTLSFGASLMAIGGAIHGALPLLMRQRPQLKLNIEVGQWTLLRQHLQQDRIEFFVSFPGTLARDSDFVVTPLRAEPSALFVRPGHPLLSGRHRLQPADLVRYPWASVQMPEAGIRRLRQRLGDAAPQMAFSCDHLGLLREAVLESNMVLFTWRSWMSEDVASGAVVDLGERLNPKWPGHDMRIECGIVQLAGRTASPAARLMMQLIADRAHRAAKTRLPN